MTNFKQQQEKNKPLKAEPTAPAIDLSEPAFIDKQEEYIRAEKEKQVKQLQEQALQDRKKKKEEQEKIKQYQKIVQDAKKKQITYDYNGQIIFVNEVKGDKLPPPAHSINYQVTNFVKEPEKKQNQSRYKAQAGASQKKANIPIQKAMQPVYRGLPEHKLPKETYQGLKSGQCFDEFTLQKGVILKYEGKVNSNILPLDQQFKSINLNDQNLKLTKQQYLSLTAEGNLNRKASQTQPAEKRTTSPGDNENLEPKETDFIATSLIPVPEKKKQQRMKKHQFRVRQKDQGIKIIAKSAYNTMRLSVDENEEHSLERQIQQQKQIETDRVVNQNIQKFSSPVDEFNFNLMNNKDWGKQSQISGSLPPLKAKFQTNRINYPKLQNQKLKKRARDRYTKDEVRKGLNLEHLPPPRIGQIVGHEQSIEYENQELEGYE